MTMRKIIPIFIVALLLSHTTTAAWAIDTSNKATKAAASSTSNINYKFISDKLPVNILNGASDTDKILRTVYSGTKLEILETSNKYSRVRTQQGKEGWVLNKYLISNPVAREKLIDTQKQMKELETTIASNEKIFNELTKLHHLLKQQSEKQDINLTRLKTENARILELAANPIKLSDANKELQKQNDLLNSQIDKILGEMEILRDYSNQQWFLKGAGVILAGMLIGVLIPKLRRNQNSKWSNLS